MIPDFGQSDVYHFNLPLKDILHKSLANNRWPLWTENLAAGFPVLAEGQIGTFYLPNLVLFKYLPLIPAYNLNLWLSLLLSSLGMYYFCRKLKLTVFVSFFSSIVFSFGGFFAVHLNHYNLIQAASLMPLIFYAFLRIRSRFSAVNLIFLSFLISQQIFTGHFYIIFISVIGLLILTLTFRKKPAFSLFALCVSLALAFLFSSIQILPTYQLLQHSSRNKGLSYQEAVSFPYPPGHLLTFFNPYYFGSPSTGSYPPFSADWGIFWENTAYLGLLPLFMIPLAYFYPGKKRLFTFTVLLFVSLLLVLGKYSPVYFLFSLPPFNFFRVPSKFLLLTSFSLTVLSGFALDRIENIIKSKLSGFPSLKLFSLSALYFLLIAVFFITEFRFSFNYPPVSASTVWTDRPEILNSISQNNTRIKTYASEIAWNDIFLNSGWQDLQKYAFLKNSLASNSNVFYNLSQIDINSGGLIPNRTRVLSLMMDNAEFDAENRSLTLNASQINLLKLWGVNRIISFFRIEDNPRIKLSTYLQVNNSRFRISLYHPYSVYPPVYLSENTVFVNSLNDFYSKLGNLEEEKLTVFIENKSNLLPSEFKNKDNSSLSFRKNDLFAKEISLRVNSKSLLVLNRSNYPGWTFFIDGKKAETVIVNLNQPAVMLQPGRHSIIFKFSSPVFETGKFITLSSMITAFLGVSLASVLPSENNRKTLPLSSRP